MGNKRKRGAVPNGAAEMDAVRGRAGASGRERPRAAAASAATASADDAPPASNASTRAARASAPPASRDAGSLASHMPSAHGAHERAPAGATSCARGAVDVREAGAGSGGGSGSGSSSGSSGSGSSGDRSGGGGGASDTASTGSSGDDESSLGSGAAAQQDVDFDFCEAAAPDFHIVKALVQRYLDGADFDSSRLTDTLIDDAQVCTVLRVGEDCVGVAAVLPLRHHAKACPALAQVATYLRERVSRELAPQLDAALASKRTGLLISERVHNAPPPLAAPLLAILLAELQAAAASKDGDAALKPYRKVDQLLVCGKAYEEDAGQALANTGALPVAPTRRHQGKKARASREPSGDRASADSLAFLRPEEESLRAHASWACTWRVPQEGEFRRQARTVRVLMLVPLPAAFQALSALAAATGHDLAQHGL